MIIKKMTPNFSINIINKLNLFRFYSAHPEQNVRPRRRRRSKILLKI